MLPTVLINARFLTQATTGVQRYAIELVKTWDAMLDSGELDMANVRFALVAPQGRLVDLQLKHIPVRQLGRFDGQLWEQFELPYHARGHFLINLCNSAPLFKRQQTVTIHDASVFGFPAAYGFRFRVWYKFLHKMLGKRLPLILTDSHFSSSELVKFCGIAEDKIHVVHLGCDHIHAVAMDAGIISRNGLNKVQFVLAVSSMSPHTNFQAIANAIPLMKNNIEGVIAGGVEPRKIHPTREGLPGKLMQPGLCHRCQPRAPHGTAARFFHS